MNLQRQRRRTLMLAFLFGILASLAAPSRAQTNRASTYGPLNAFAGTWTAKRPGQSTPFLVLTLHESNGTLTGTMNHFKLGVVGNGTIIGTPTSGESPLAGLNVQDGDLRFVWGQAPLGGDEAKFVLEGTTKAQVVIMVPQEHLQKIMAGNPGASGLNPVIYVSRETETGNATETASSPEKWEVGMMASLINTSEAQYKFAHGTYALYATLLRTGQLEKTGGRDFTLEPMKLHSETDPLPGYRIRLLVSQEGDSYQLAIQEKTAQCGSSLFSDETGVIFEGHALDDQWRDTCHTWH